MPRAKASHCLRRISQGEPRAPLPLRNAEGVLRFSGQRLFLTANDVRKRTK
jgi:hypothetical protein